MKRWCEQQLEVPRQGRGYQSRALPERVWKKTPGEQADKLASWPNQGQDGALQISAANQASQNQVKLMSDEDLAATADLCCERSESEPALSLPWCWLAERLVSLSRCRRSDAGLRYGVPAVLAAVVSRDGV